MLYNVTVRDMTNIAEELTFECDENKTIRQLCEENNIHISLNENCSKNLKVMIQLPVIGK